MALNFFRVHREACRVNIHIETTVMKQVMDALGSNLYARFHPEIPSFWPLARPIALCLSYHDARWPEIGSTVIEEKIG